MNKFLDELTGQNRNRAGISAVLFCALIAVLLFVAWLTSNRDDRPKPGPLPTAFGSSDAETQAAALQEFSSVPESPEEVQDLGNFGYRPPTAEEQRETFEQIKTLDQEAPHLYRDGGNDARGPPEAESFEPIILTGAIDRAAPGWKVGKQGIGDCVSWGWSHGAAILTAQTSLTTGNTFRWPATEAMYGGSRVEARGRSTGGWSDGSYGGAAAKFASQWGIVYRQPFDEFGYDLSSYSAQRAKQWGNYGCGGQGDNGRLDEVAKKHPCSVALVRNWDDTVAAMRSGYPVPVCSGQGFSSTRDADGFARAQGSWSHCMCGVGIRFAAVGGKDGVLILNSWGTNWIGGSKWPAEGGDKPPQPDGSFWCERRVWERMLSGNDSFAISNLQGFPRRKLRHDQGW